MISKHTYRLCQALLLLISLFMLGASFYFQYVKGLEPCPLCLMQRLCVFMLVVFFLLGTGLSTLKQSKVITIGQLFFASAGIFFALRHLWLQLLPPEQAPACMPGLDVLIRYFPWQDVVHSLLWGAGDCAEVTWRWLGLSMPAWAALYFLAMFISSGVIFYLIRESIFQVKKR